MAEITPPYDYSAVNLVRAQPPLISVAGFQQAAETTINQTDFSFLDKLRCTEEEEKALDVEVPDLLKYRTPHEQIQLAVTRAIEQDAARRGDPSLAVPDLSTEKRSQITDQQRKHIKELQTRAEIPQFKELVLAEANSKLQARRHLEMLRKARVHQTVEREINYCPEPNRDVDADDPLDPKVPLVHFAYYHPKRHNQKMLELLVLGTNTLEQLRDKLYCLYDEVGPTNIRFQSSMFYINDTFYVDQREGVPRPTDDPEAYKKEHSDDCSEFLCEHPLHRPRRMDYSKEISDWMKVATPENEFRRKWKERQGLQTLSMSTPISKLSFEYGTPYLFMHQGNCQHLLVVLDVRLPTTLDVNSRSEYPLVVFQGKLRRRKCFLCDTYTASHVTYEDKHAPCDPCFWCEQCFRRMHFDEHGIKTYDGWKAYPYQHE